MADTKITALTADTSPTGDDLVATVNDPGGTPANRKVTLTNLSKAITPEGTNVLSTGEAGGSKFLREDGDGTSSWQAIPGGGDALTSSPLSQFAATTSAQLAGVISDETGSGALAFATSPTLVTPNIGVATATSVNKVAITAPATGATLVIPDGVTATAPAASDTLVGRASTDTLTNKTLGATTMSGTLTSQNVVPDANVTYDLGSASRYFANSFLFQTTFGGATSGSTVLAAPAVAAGTVTLPSATSTLVGKDTTDTLTNKTFDANGTGNSLSNVEVADMAASAVVTAADTVAANDNDTTLPTSAAVIDYVASAGGGQTLVTHIVAASGGTHTTLGAAITAASNGDTIWVREGTYVESAITSALTDITIIGENPQTSVISMGANTLTLSGTKVTLQNVAITSTTGGIAHSGTYGTYRNCNLTISGNGHLLNVTGQGTRVISCIITDTNVSTHSTATVTISGGYGQLTDCFFSLGVRRGSATNGTVAITGDQTTVANNRFLAASIAATSTILSMSGNYGTISNNVLNVSDDATVARNIYCSGAKVTISNNVIEDGIIGIYCGGDGSISTNCIRCTGTTPTGIYVEAAGTTVTGNQITATGGTAIHENGSNYVVISGNTILTGSVGINIVAGGAYQVISGNGINSSVTTPIVDASVSSIITNNSGAPATLDKRMLKMKNTSGGALAAGDVVVLKAVAAGDEVTTTTTAGDNMILGMATSTINDNALGQIQIAGKTAALKVDGTTDIAIGDFLTTFTTAKIAAKASAGQQAFAIALEAYTNNDSNGVIDALLVTPRQV